jgi:uncharacterized protein (DUF433 family)
MTKTLQGKVHGKTIELERETGLPDGHQVQVEIRSSDGPPAWLERLDIDPNFAPGKLLIKGTHLLAEDLARLVEEPRTDDELGRLHPELTPEDWDAIRNYARLPLALRRSFGAWANYGEQLDEFLEEIRSWRKLPRRGLEG